MDSTIERGGMTHPICRPPPGPPSPRPSGLLCYNTGLFHNPKIFEPDGLVITHDIRWICKIATDIRDRMIKERPRRQQRSTKVPLSTERNCSCPGQELGEPNVFGQNRGNWSDVRKEMRTLEDALICFASSPSVIVSYLHVWSSWHQLNQVHTIRHLDRHLLTGQREIE